MYRRPYSAMSVFTTIKLAFCNATVWSITSKHVYCKKKKVLKSPVSLQKLFSIKVILRAMMILGIFIDQQANIFAEKRDEART